MEPEPKRWKIGAWEFNISSRSLQRDGRTERLAQNEGRLLTFLIRNFSEDPEYTNNDIKQRVWTRDFVEDENLYKAVSNLAKILGEKEGEYLGKRPYRLIQRPIPIPSSSATSNMSDLEGSLALPKHTEAKALTVWHIPYARNPLFKGRDVELRSICDASKLRTEMRVVQVLAGLPGLGKTSIAVEYAYRLRKQYSLVWWFDASNDESLSKGYEALAKRLDPKHQQCGLSPVAYVSDTLTGFTDWLLIFDRALSSDDILSLLPKTGTGHVIITSVDRAWKGEATIVDVPPMDAAAARAFLNDRLAGRFPYVDSDLFGELAAELSYIPAALEIASAYLDVAGCTIPHYIRKIRALRHKSPISLLMSDKTAEFVIHQAWDLALMRAHCQSPALMLFVHWIQWLDDCEIPLDAIEAVDLPLQGVWQSWLTRFIFFIRPLFLRRYLPPPKPPLPALSASYDSFSFRAALATLQRYSLISLSRSHFSVAQTIKAMARTRQFKYRRKKSCRMSLFFTAVMARDSITRQNWNATNLWARHLQKRH